MLTFTFSVYSVAIGAVLAVIEAVLVVLFFILLVVDFIQLLVFLVRGVKANKRAKHALSNPTVEAPMMAESATPASGGGNSFVGLGNGGLHPDGYAGVERHSSDGERTRSSMTLDDGQQPRQTWKAV
jgi:hypothetical protein